MINFLTVLAFLASIIIAALKFAAVSVVASVSWWLVILMIPAVFIGGLIASIVCYAIFGLIVGGVVWAVTRWS